MPKFTLSFETESADAFEAAISALAEIHGGYQPQIADSTKPEPVMIANPETREDFVRRKLFETLKAQIIAHNSAKAVGTETKRIALAADQFTVTV